MALYFERPARPKKKPAASHSGQAGARGAKKSRDKDNAAADSAKSSGPSGTIQLPAEAKKNGVTLRAKIARSPARGPNRSRVRRNISQPVTAKSAMKGRRTSAPSPKAKAAKWAIHWCRGG